MSDTEMLLCGQCGEQPAAMVKVGTDDGWCVTCLDEAAEPAVLVSVSPVPHLCRTCMRPITYETRTETGYKPRTGWYDDCHVDALVCFKAVRYRHEPLTARERAYYEAGWQAALDAATSGATP